MDHLYIFHVNTNHLGLVKFGLSFNFILERLRYPGPVYGYGRYTRTRTRKSVKHLQLKKSKIPQGMKTNQRMVVFVVKIHQKLYKIDIYALSIWLIKMLKYFTT